MEASHPAPRKRKYSLGNSTGLNSKRLSSCAVPFRVLVLFLASSNHGVAQEAPKPGPLPEAPTPKPSAAESRQKSGSMLLQATLGILGHKSVFYPDLAYERGPLSSKQKFELFIDGSVAPSRLIASAMGAGIGQARNSLDGYGQEWGGYGKRFGASLASGTSNQFFSKFLLPTVLHQDPRYFVKLHGLQFDVIFITIVIKIKIWVTYFVREKSTISFIKLFTSSEISKSIRI